MPADRTVRIGPRQAGDRVCPAARYSAAAIARREEARRSASATPFSAACSGSAVGSRRQNMPSTNPWAANSARDRSQITKQRSATGFSAVRSARTAKATSSAAMRPSACLSSCIAASIQISRKSRDNHAAGRRIRGQKKQQEKHKSLNLLATILKKHRNCVVLSNTLALRVNRRGENSSDAMDSPRDVACLTAARGARKLRQRDPETLG